MGTAWQEIVLAIQNPVTVAWVNGALARMDNQGKGLNPHKFSPSKPAGNAEWSNWNHGWSWADMAVHILRDRISKLPRISDN